MSTNHAPLIAGELHLSERSVTAALQLFDEGATIPFVARYRKERTGALDEVALLSIRDRFAQLVDLANRKQAVLHSLSQLGIDDPELRNRIESASTRSEVEDLYLPYRPKRRTRAGVARERGLEPLADRIWTGDAALGSRKALEAAAEPLVDREKELADADAVLSGVRDILAERVSEMPAVRADLRDLFERRAELSSKPARGSKAGDELKAKFRDYLSWSEPASRAPSHRVLAVMRGCREGVLSCRLLPSEEQARSTVQGRLRAEGALPSATAARQEIVAAADDAYDRLLSTQLETELRNDVIARAEAEAVAVFARNLRELLMSPPLAERTVLAVDPGFRTGCKVAVLSRSGDLLHYETIHPLEPQKQVDAAASRIRSLAREHSVEAVAVGNGTGGRETVDFCRSLGLDATVVMVDESGASVYSASEQARREFPDHDVTVRGAVSIGRRLQDPLAELVKVDPKSIGVGQYQHDVDQKLLASALEDVVVSCVNAVGVEVNTASAALLRFVSGVSDAVAESIVAYRREKGPFESRRQLLSVSGVGPKSFELAAGFLRVRGGKNPLDSSAVHPERYEVVERMARDLGVSVGELVGNARLVATIDAGRYVDDTVGLPTVRDILDELAKPGRDPRSEFVAFGFADGLKTIDDLSVGMKVPGIVTNVTAFGAFVDIGVHNDGLVHVSKMADRYVQNPHEVVKVHQQVEVTVISIDKERSRIGLSMREGETHE